MRSLLLATLAALAVSLPARADYVVLIANLNAKPDPADATGGGLLPGAAPGMTTPYPGSTGSPSSSPSTPYPAPGSTPYPAPGSTPYPSPGPGMSGSSSGPGYPGMAGYPGMPGYPGMGGPNEADDEPHLIVVVIEGVGLEASLKKFNAGMPITFRHRWGGTVQLQKKTAQYEVIPLETGAGRALPSVRRQFATLQEEATKSKAGPVELLKLARWTLEHGLVEEFTKVMDKVAEADKAHPAVAAYLKVKEELAQPIAGEDVAAAWRKRVVDGYRITQDDKHHYALLHNLPGDNAAEGQAILDRLEKSLHSFYYWWAINGITLPLPKTRQVAVLAEKAEDFRRLHKALSSSPVLADSFFARREGLSVFSSKRNDEGYVALAKVSEPLWEKGFDRHRLLTSIKSSDGVPRDLTRGMLLPQIQQIANGPRTVAVMLKALEEEWEATSMTHEATRQLLFASGLVPRNVNVPEWLQFGFGSFFEQPLQSPWGGAGAANPYWLPRFKQYRADKNKPYGNSAVETLTRVVTDSLFRGKPAAGETKESRLRRARAASWALTFFLARQDLEGLRRYFKELSKMPRDLELDDKVLLGCFARAFDCVNPDGSVNQSKLSTMASRWISFINDQPLEAETVHKKIRSFYDQMSKAKPPMSNPPPGTPGYPGLTTPGTRPPSP